MLISDWSSYVCSSDLLDRPARARARPAGGTDRQGGARTQRAAARIGARGFSGQGRRNRGASRPGRHHVRTRTRAGHQGEPRVEPRSEERRVGKEWVSTCITRWLTSQKQKKKI